jgi:putative nucleotidyltransferase with HDIG domain
MGNGLHLFGQKDQNSAFEVEQRKKTLRVILWVIFIGGFVLGITNFIFGFILAGITVLVLCSACLAAMYLNQKGYYNAAATIISCLLFFVVVFDITDAGGLGNDLGMVAFPPLILVWGLLLGKRGLTFFSGLCIIVVGIIGYLDIQGVIYAPTVQTGWGDLFTALVLLIVTAVLLWVILDNAKKNLEKIKNDDESVRVSYELTLEGLVKTLELRDQETEHHSRRVVALSLKLAEALELGEDDRLNIYRGALLHDIGKLGVPDYILLKPGPLSEEEWVEMRKHTEHAHSILANIPFLQSCISIPYYHHERWDGAGYPHGLKAEEIPYPARVFTIVDQWEALTSDRVYRKAWPREKALAYIRDNLGKIYEPEIAFVFLNSIDQIEAQIALDPTSRNEEPGQPDQDDSQKSSQTGSFRWDRNKNKHWWMGSDQDSPFEINQRRLTLNVILGVVIAASLGLGWISINGGGLSLDVWITLALSGLCLLGLFLNTSRYFTTIAIGICLLMLFAAGVNLYTRQGLHDMGIVAFPVIIVIGSLFLGKRGLIILTLANAFIISSIGFLEINKSFRPDPFNTQLGDVIALVILILAVSVLLWSLLDHAEKTRLRIKKKEAELRESYDLTLEGFAKAYEFRGREPKGHSQRVVELSLRLARKIGLEGSELENVRRGALLHDIGTLFIPDQIMLKPGPLLEEEWAVMKRHPERARELLAKIPYLKSSIAIPYCHHENWDGTGYPQGLKREDIPLPARLFALVDQWEELSMNRPFRQAWSTEKVMNYIRENAGKLYDPDLAASFIEMMESEEK